MARFTLTLEGTKPLIQHNPQLSDPLNTFAREIKKVSAKRSKTDEDHMEMARIEFTGSLYFDKDLGPVIPSYMIKASMVSGAKKLRLGSTVKTEVNFDELVTPLIYSGGNRTIEELWGDGDSENVHRASVRVRMARVMRTRPIFHDWSLEIEGSYDDNELDQDQIRQIFNYAGRAGLGDSRPDYGTYKATVKFHN